jgi:hypothetical protein
MPQGRLLDVSFLAGGRVTIQNECVGSGVRGPQLSDFPPKLGTGGSHPGGTNLSDVDLPSVLDFYPRLGRKTC